MAALVGFVLAAVGGLPPVHAEVTATAPVAEVNGDPISAADLDRALGAKLRKLEEQIYDLKRTQLDALIAERLVAQEAARRGTSIAGLLDAEVTAKVGPVTEQEVEAFYQTNKDRLRGEEAVVREQVRTYLQQQKLAAQRARFVGALRCQTKIGRDLVWRDGRRRPACGRFAGTRFYSDDPRPAGALGA
jgi:hypothetical protein